MWVLYPGRIGIWSVFVEGGKPENPEKNLGARTRTNNKLNPHMTPGAGIEPKPYWWEERAITTTPSLARIYSSGNDCKCFVLEGNNSAN